jgi:hypothetical protein
VNTRTFLTGIAVCLALMIAAGFGINTLNSGHSRPEGVAEDWLTAVGDTARKGVEADATRRAEAIGPLELAGQPLIGTEKDTDGKSAFPDLEVGKAVRTGETADVRFRVHSRREKDNVEIVGAIRLVRTDGRWMVTQTQLFTIDGLQVVPRPGVTSFGENTPELASEGGPPPSSASNSLWLLAIVIGVAVTAGASGIVHWAGRQPTLATAG